MEKSQAVLSVQVALYGELLNELSSFPSILVRFLVEQAEHGIQ